MALVLSLSSESVGMVEMTELEDKKCTCVFQIPVCKNREDHLRRMKEDEND